MRDTGDFFNLLSTVMISGMSLLKRHLYVTAINFMTHSNLEMFPAQLGNYYFFNKLALDDNARIWRALRELFALLLQLGICAVTGRCFSPRDKHCTSRVSIIIIIIIICIRYPTRKFTKSGE